MRRGYYGHKLFADLGIAGRGFVGTGAGNVEQVAVIFIHGPAGVPLH